MAKAQAMKPKTSFGGWFKRKPKAARPAASVQSTTMTNLTAGTPTRPGKSGAAPKAEKPGMGFTHFRLPFIGAKPITTQMQVLGATALLLLVATAALVFWDTTLRTRSATY